MEKGNWLSVQFDAEVSKSESSKVATFRVKKVRGTAVFLESRTCELSDLDFKDNDTVNMRLSLPGEKKPPVVSARVIRVGQRPSLPREQSPIVFLGAKLDCPFSRLLGGVLEASDEGREVSAESDAPQRSEESEVPYVHMTTAQFEELLRRILSLSFSDLGRLNDFEQTVNELFSALTRVEREFVQTAIKEKNKENTSTILQGQILNLALQMEGELRSFRRVSRSTAGTLSIAVENVLGEFQEEAETLEKRVHALSERLLGSEQQGDSHLMNRRLGVLDQGLREFRLFHLAQVLRDTQQGSHPRPLEELWTVAPRSLKSYEMSVSGKVTGENGRRSLQPEALRECAAVFESWKKASKADTGASSEFALLGHGLALEAKTRVETKGASFLLQGTERLLFRFHVDHLRSSLQHMYKEWVREHTVLFSSGDPIIGKHLGELDQRIQAALGVAVSSSEPERKAGTEDAIADAPIKQKPTETAVQSKEVSFWWLYLMVPLLAAALGGGAWWLWSRG